MARDRWRRQAGSRLSADVVVPLVLLAFFAAVPLAAAAAQSYLLSLFMRVMIFAIAAIGLDFILGYGGLISFGHAAFIGLGAYAVGILAAHDVHESAIALAVALAVVDAVRLPHRPRRLRTKGVYFIMITLAFAQMAFFTASSLAPYGGDDGLTIHMRDTVFGFAAAREYASLLLPRPRRLAASYVLCRALIASRFGRVFRGTRENPARMAAIGFDTMRFRLVAYVVSGALGGLSGFLLANATDFVSPAYMSWQRSGDLLIMVIFGGMGRLYGAVIGALAFLLLEERLADFTENWKVIVGPLLVVVAVFARGGLVGVAERLWRARRG